jgi:hypothetical protein
VRSECFTLKPIENVDLLKFCLLLFFHLHGLEFDLVLDDIVYLTIHEFFLLLSFWLIRLFLLEFLGFGTGFNETLLAKNREMVVLSKMFVGDSKREHKEFTGISVLTKMLLLGTCIVI